MALITQTSTQQGQNLVESFGSLKVVFMPLTTGSTSDTFQLGTGLPIVALDTMGGGTTAAQPNNGDATYNSTTGIVTIVAPYFGSTTLVLYMRT